MFTKKKPYEPSAGLEEAMTVALSRLSELKDDPKAFTAAVKDIDALYELAYPGLKKEAKKQIDPNAIIAAGASLLGIVAILGYEHGHIITSKALGFVVKTKI